MVGLLFLKSSYLWLFSCFQTIIVATCMVIVWRVLSKSKLAKERPYRQLAIGFGLIGLSFWSAIVTPAILLAGLGDSAEHYVASAIYVVYFISMLAGTAYIVAGTIALRIAEASDAA